jgi:hypothetical protein
MTVENYISNDLQTGSHYTSHYTTDYGYKSGLGCVYAQDVRGVAKARLDLPRDMGFYMRYFQSC